MCSFAVVFVVPNADDTDLSHCGTKLREEIFKLTNHVGQQLDSAPQLIPGYGYGRRDITSPCHSVRMFRGLRQLPSTMYNTPWRIPCGSAKHVWSMYSDILMGSEVLYTTDGMESSYIRRLGEIGMTDILATTRSACVDYAVPDAKESPQDMLILTLMDIERGGPQVLRTGRTIRGIDSH